MSNDVLLQSLPVPPLSAASHACMPVKVSNAYALLQEKWTLFIVHALLDGPTGFNEMGRRAGPVNTTTLAQRLVNLEHAGIVRKTIHSTMPPRTSYTLTEAGLALKPVLDAIRTWSEQYVPDEPVVCPQD